MDRIGQCESCHLLTSTIVISGKDVCYHCHGDVKVFEPSRLSIFGVPKPF